MFIDQIYHPINKAETLQEHTINSNKELSQTLWLIIMQCLSYLHSLS